MNEGLLHFLAAITSIGLSGIGLALGLAIAQRGMVSAVLRQPAAANEIQKTFWYGIIVAEAAFIFSLLISMIILLVKNYQNLTLPIALAELGMSLAIGLSTGLSALAAGCAVKSACSSVSRQPLLSSKIQYFLFAMQTLIEIPVFIAVAISIIIYSKINQSLNLSQASSLLGAGLCFGLGTIGPTLGQLFLARSSCYAFSLNKEQQAKVTNYSLTAGLFIEMPVLLCFVFSILMTIKTPAKIINENLMVLAACIICNCLSGAGASFALSKISSLGVNKIAMQPKFQSEVFSFSIITNVFIEVAVFLPALITLIILLKT